MKPGSAVVASALALALALGASACNSDASRSPACGIALLAGPAVIHEQLNNARAIITDAPRGLPERLPAMVIQQKAATVQVGYDADGRILLGYEGPGFPAGGGFGLLVVDDTSQRAMGVLIFEGREPSNHPRLGSVTGAGPTLNLYGVRVDWAGVSNPRCPLLGPPPAPQPA